MKEVIKKFHPVLLFPYIIEEFWGSLSTKLTGFGTIMCVIAAFATGSNFPISVVVAIALASGAGRSTTAYYSKVAYCLKHTAPVDWELWEQHVAHDGNLGHLARAPLRWPLEPPLLASIENIWYWTKELELQPIADSVAVNALSLNEQKGFCAARREGEPVCIWNAFSTSPSMVHGLIITMQASNQRLEAQGWSEWQGNVIYFGSTYLSIVNLCFIRQDPCKNTSTNIPCMIVGGTNEYHSSKISSYTGLFCTCLPLISNLRTWLAAAVLFSVIYFRIAVFHIIIIS